MLTQHPILRWQAVFKWFLSFCFCQPWPLCDWAVPPCHLIALQNNLVQVKVRTIQMSLCLVMFWPHRTHPVLIQGETSVGKTSLIRWLAAATGSQCVRINNHEHTDIQEYIGCYSSDDRGKLVFKEGTSSHSAVTDFSTKTLYVFARTSPSLHMQLMFKQSGPSVYDWWPNFHQFGFLHHCTWLEKKQSRWFN